LNSKFIEYKIQLIKINDSIETTSILSLINNSIQSSVNFAINHPVITAIATISVLALFGYCWYIYSLPNNDLILINEELSKLKLQNKSLKLKIDNLDKTVSEFGMKDLPDVNTQVQINRELVKELENVKSIQNSEILKLINIKQIQISEINKLDKVRSIQKMQKTDLTKLSDSVEHGRSDLQIVAQAVHRLNT
jgi:hypothetical protein